MSQRHAFSTFNEIIRNYHLLELNVPESRVRNIAHKDPSNLEYSFPFIGCPDSTTACVIDGRHHLGHTAEVARSINTEKEVDRASSGSLFKCLI